MVNGNYLVLEFPETKLSTDDYQYLIKLNQKKPITVKVTGKEEANVTLDISGIVLEQKTI